MLYNDLNDNEMTIKKIEKLLEKVANRLNQERYNSIDVHIQNDSLKELIVKLRG